MSARRRVALVAMLLAAMPVVWGCGETTRAATDVAGHKGHTTARPGWDQFSTPSFDLDQCSHKYPGEMMTEAEAVVTFSRTGICPGYVTVDANTAVRWRNADTAAFTVTIRRDAPDGPVLEQLVVAPGTTRTTQLSAGRYAYATDAIESFRGWVDVAG